MNEQSPQSDQNNCNDTEEQHQNDGYVIRYGL